MSKGGVGAEIILSAVMEGGGSGNKVSIKHSTFEAQVLCPPPQLMAKHFVSSTPFLNFDMVNKMFGHLTKTVFKITHDRSTF